MNFQTPAKHRITLGSRILGNRPSQGYTLAALKEHGSKGEQRFVEKLEQERAAAGYTFQELTPVVWQQVLLRELLIDPTDYDPFAPVVHRIDPLPPGHPTPGDLQHIATFSLVAATRDVCTNSVPGGWKTWSYTISQWEEGKKDRTLKSKDFDVYIPVVFNEYYRYWVLDKEYPHGRMEYNFTSKSFTEILRKVLTSKACENTKTIFNRLNRAFFDHGYGGGVEPINQLQIEPLRVL